jgi:hypothetical protein
MRIHAESALSAQIRAEHQGEGKLLAVRKIFAVRKILGNHAHLLRDRDILFIEERLRKDYLKIGLGNIRSIAAIRKELGSFVRKRFRKGLGSFDRGSHQDPPSKLSHNNPRVCLFVGFLHSDDLGSHQRPTQKGSTTLSSTFSKTLMSKKGSMTLLYGGTGQLIILLSLNTY